MPIVAWGANGIRRSRTGRVRDAVIGWLCAHAAATPVNTTSIAAAATVACQDVATIRHQPRVTKWSSGRSEGRRGAS